MKLKGGVIIIGSLIWDDHLKDNDNIRARWRKLNLVNEPILTKVPIRYGRQSSSRKDTYTMILSKFHEDKLGQGLILPFIDDIISFDKLKKQAIELAIAEGIYNNKNTRLTSNWGAVGLLINPKIAELDFESKLIKREWSNIYKYYENTFNHNDYKIDKEETSPITKNGFLNISWQEEMNPFDLLIATPVVPKPKRFLSEEEIAEAMIKKSYQDYFQNNKKNNIYTVQDTSIQSYLDKK